MLARAKAAPRHTPHLGTTRVVDRTGGRLRVNHIGPAPQPRMHDDPGQPTPPRDDERTGSRHSRDLFGVGAPEPNAEDDPARFTPAPAPTFIGQYEVVRVLGSGGMGTVYEAIQDAPRRRVALKVMREATASDDAVRRFEREARILGTLQHPGIAQVYDAGMTALPEAERGVAGPRSVPYFAMELLHGAVSLTEHARRANLDHRAVLMLMAQVCDAVGHAHQRGVVHRDLKPSNILVDSAGRVRVIDFGVARIVGAGAVANTLHTHPGTIVGTLQYMSPEQVGDDPTLVDARSDVYSLGAVLYELLCGTVPVPVRGVAILAAAELVRTHVPLPPSRIVKGLRPDVQAVVMKALAKGRADRYASAEELRDDLLRAAEGVPVLARPLGPATLAARAARRWANARPWSTACLVVAATVGLCRWVVAPVSFPAVAEIQALASRFTPPTVPSGGLADVRLIAFDPASTPERLEPALGLEAGTMGREFGRRPVIAGLIRRLAEAGAGAIAVDFFLVNESPFDDAVADAAAYARSRGIDVVFASPTWMSDDGAAPLAPKLRPIVRWGGASARSGMGVLTQMELSVENPDHEGVPSLALAAVTALESPGVFCTTASRGDAPLLEVRRWRAGAVPGGPMASAGPAKLYRVSETERAEADEQRGISHGATAATLHLSFPTAETFDAARLSVADAVTIDMQALRAQVGGRIALIGWAGAPPGTLDDTISLPDGRKLFGSEAHLATMQALRDGGVVRLPTLWEDHAWIALGAGLGIFLMVIALRTWVRVSLLLAGWAVLLAGSLGGAAWFATLIDPVLPCAGVVIGAVLWMILVPRAVPPKP
jgi:serine/threonine protein kinase